MYLVPKEASCGGADRAFSMVDFWDLEAATIARVYTLPFLPEEVRLTKSESGVEATFLLLRPNINIP